LLGNLEIAEIENLKVYFSNSLTAVYEVAVILVQPL
jgi:hypothetical protein